MPKVPHTIESARKEAEAMAEAELLASGLELPARPFCDECMEAEGCWVFFLDAHKKSTIQSGQLVFTAYAVPKNGGETAFVYDFRPDLEKMQCYVDLWSLHALGKKGEVLAALESFLGKYPSA